MEEYQDHSLGSRVFQKIRDNILNLSLIHI